MIVEYLKRMAPLGKSMFYVCIFLALLFVTVPLFKSIPIDFSAVLGCLILRWFWWLLGKWHENETKDPY